MSVEINSVVIGGNLARDVELKEIASGKKVASFAVASNRTYLSNGQKEKETVFIDVDVWGPSAENCNQYLKKGSPVVVVGRLKQDQWESEGQKRSRLKIVASNVQFLPSKKKEEVSVE
ncbi:MAG: single-stranded DNA-binding protein [Candidatus Omnitrophica bacterium]|nr:single-stranded DNA-binding protein [Candidatus Omnitrophota bacterium]